MGNYIHPRLVTRIARALHGIWRHGLISERWLERRLLEAIEEWRRVHPGEAEPSRGWWARAFKRSVSDRDQAKACADTLRLEGDVTPARIEQIIAPKLASSAAIQAINKFLDRHSLDTLAVPLDALEDEAFCDLVDAGVYRFAYGRYGDLEGEQQIVFGQTGGAYVIFLKAAGASESIERRLLAFRDEPRINGVRAIELSRKDAKLQIRTGLIAPRMGVHSVLLSDEINEPQARNLLKEFVDNDIPDQALTDMVAAAMSARSQGSWLDMHALAFYSFRSDSANRISGSFLDADRFGAIAGRRLDGDVITAAELEAVDQLGRAHDAGLDRTDRILIDQMPRLSVDEIVLAYRDRSPSA